MLPAFLFHNKKAKCFFNLPLQAIKPALLIHYICPHENSHAYKLDTIFMKMAILNQMMIKRKLHYQFSWLPG